MDDAQPSVRGGSRRGPVSVDVARLAGVSQKTVSRVMNNEPLVSTELRERVWRASRQLGYRPNSAARALAAGRTYRIGFVSLGTTLHGPVATLVAAERAARERGYSMTIATTADRTGVSRAVESVLEQGAEGVVVSEPIDLGGVHLTVDVPVLIFGHFPGLSAPHVISTLNSGDQSAALATRHLLGSGHPTVHHIAGPDSWFAARERLQGWQQALAAAGAAVPQHQVGDWTAESGYRAGCRLAEAPDVSAIFCANDDMAFGAIRALREAGRSVPEDVSVMGFDDVPVAAYSSPSLSTIRHPFDAGSVAGIGALIEVIEDPLSVTPQLGEPPGELILRESTGPARRGSSPEPGGGRRP